MLVAVKANREYKIDEKSLEDFKKKGFKIVDLDAKSASKSKPKGKPEGKPGK